MLGLNKVSSVLKGILLTFAGEANDASVLGVTDVLAYRGSKCKFASKNVKFTRTYTHAKVLFYPDARLVVFTTANGLCSTRNAAVLITVNRVEAQKLWTWLGKSDDCPPLRRPTETASLSGAAWIELLSSLDPMMFKNAGVGYDEFVGYMKSMSESLLSLEWLTSSHILEATAPTPSSTSYNPNNPGFGGSAHHVQSRKSALITLMTLLTFWRYNPFACTHTYMMN